MDRQDRHKPEVWRWAKTSVCWLFVLLASACAAATEANTPTPTSAPANTSPPETRSTLAAPTQTIVDTASPTPEPTVDPPAKSAPTARPTQTPLAGPVVNIGGAQFAVDLAVTAGERSQGLSGRPSLAPDTGMLFVFEQPGRFTFWMVEMQFPLDLVWISADCAVVDLTQNAPPPQPGQNPSDLPRYQPAEPIQYVLEVNAGVIESTGIAVGDPVAFEGDLAGVYGC